MALGMLAVAVLFAWLVGSDADAKPDASLLPVLQFYKPFHFCNGDVVVHVSSELLKSSQFHACSCVISPAGEYSSPRLISRASREGTNPAC